MVFRFSGTAAVLISLTVLSFACSSAFAWDLSVPGDVGLLLNFSVPCDLNSAIAIPDGGGLLVPVLLAIGRQDYTFNGSDWVFVNQEALLYNKTLATVGRLFGTADGEITFEIPPQSVFDTTVTATVTALPIVSVPQMFSIDLQLLNVTSANNTSTYSSADYVQRFGTLKGIPPSLDVPAKSGDSFSSQFAAFYAFYLPFNTSPQLATRVPRCGDERFYGIQFRG